MNFVADIRLKGINPYVLINAERAKRIKAGWKKPLPVLVQVNGKPDQPFRINLMPIGDGSFYLYLHGKIRQALSVQVGDCVKIGIAFDGSYQNGPQHELPTEFAVHLNDNAAAKAGWEILAPSRQKEILRYLANLKSGQARVRNVERAIRVLAGAKERFMARDWN